MGVADWLAGAEAPKVNDQLFGVVRAEVIDNVDLTRQGRVQLRIPTIPNVTPWASVCAPFAGQGYGLWCMPQVGDQVVVAFEHGDANWPVVVGSIWDINHAPPIDLPSEASTKRVLQTPNGHSLVFDDLEMECTLTHAAGHRLTIDAKGITLELAKGLATFSLSLPGEAQLTSKVKAEVSSTNISVSGTGSLDLSGGATSLSASTTCQVEGSLVTIN